MAMVLSRTMPSAFMLLTTKLITSELKSQSRQLMPGQEKMHLARTVDQSRRELIARAVRESRFVRNSELSSRFGVSTVTIRQDIDVLSARGLLQKTYGGAVFNPEGNLDSSFDQRSSLNAEAKRRIGRAAARSIARGETIILDSGSTTIEIARHLPENQDVTVVTCALNIALEAANRPGVTVIVCGGRLNARTLSTADQQ